MENKPSSVEEDTSIRDKLITGLLLGGALILVPSVVIDKIPDNSTLVLWITAGAIAMGTAVSNRN